MLKPHSRRLVALASAVLLSTCMATAQEPAVAWSDAKPANTSQWPTTANLDGSRDLIVVTAARPKRRQKCRVQSFDTDRIVCLPHRGHQSMAFDRTEVAALIRPGSHENLWIAIPEGVLLGGAAITGAVYLSRISTLATVLGDVVAGLLCYGAWAGIGLSHDQNKPDRLLYLRPGDRLQVVLRWQYTTL